MHAKDATSIRAGRPAIVSTVKHRAEGRRGSPGIAMRQFLLPLICLAFGVFGGWWLSGIFGQRAIDRTIAMSWGDGKYGKQFYGAQVYAVPQGSEYSVRARILIGPGNGYYHDCEEIGRAATVQEAIERFGKILWEEKGLTIGDPAVGGFHLPRAP